jgi:hypothetical protein
MYNGLDLNPRPLLRLKSERPFHVQGMPVITVNSLVDAKRTIGKKWRAE